jgi:hypothetical protein
MNCGLGFRLARFFVAFLVATLRRAPFLVAVLLRALRLATRRADFRAAVRFRLVARRLAARAVLLRVAFFLRFAIGTSYRVVNG